MKIDKFITLRNSKSKTARQHKRRTVYNNNLNCIHPLEVESNNAD